MPNKYPERKGYKVPKQKHRVRNWKEYNQALANRGRIDIWMHEDA
ncbi:IS5/IS1182 family transposase, partial [Francisella philomiragia]|nr:IS5/IS1182 family transposase [Francisella philomiragia]